MSQAPASSASWRAAAANLAVLALLAACAVALLPWHDDAWWNAAPRPRQAWFAAIALAAYAGFCLVLACRHRPRASALPVADTAQASVLVVHASQTGFAHEIALRTHGMLRDAGIPAELHALGKLDIARLQSHRRALFVASTTGEGDAPDTAIAFIARAMTRQVELGDLGYAVLALGDRTYDRFCGFGHQLEQWLHRNGARPLFDLVEVDNGDPGALRHWQRNVAQLAGATEAPDWTAPRYDTWTLQERRLANPGSVGGEAFRIALQPPRGMSAAWQAGDLLEIGPRHGPDAVEACLAALALAGNHEITWQHARMTLREALARARLPMPQEATGISPQAVADALQPLPHREYSLASLPADGTAQLLVRRMLRADGTPGLGSGWLCTHATTGSGIAARVRANPNFHAPDPSRPMLLVGNGTGIAGLRAHLCARIHAGARRNWLVYGERNAERDDVYRDDIAAWRRDGWLERVDGVFSRDGGEHRYVQDVLRASSAALRAWIADGGVVYVCGSLQGMAPGVDAVLRDVLGTDTVDAMHADGRYRRDVY